MASGESVLAELLVDYLWKVGIVVVLALLVGIAMVVIWRKVGSK
ncbi:hypothetical protein GCM10010174_36100 [Kutzneria viridogrisea]|uniref:Uncharacterized protein n=2 Tax=Kutzneria TaxID=43356 RepID=A0ABR6BLN3_9PSEU|nr:hypothetical protein [Kutzneria albida]AHH94836.1 putative membrane protein [Kutzneria albida DSM 43870]MBA8927820.1 hypothetical protein [Kutzneria viridogrisea]